MWIRCMWTEEYLYSMKPQNKIQLSIPTPCQENWDLMTTQEQGRHCAVCHKTVIDFITMSDEEIMQYFIRNKEKVCGRISSDKLVEQPARLTQKIKLFLYSLATVFLLGGSFQVQAQTVDMNDSSVQMDTCSIQGKVLDENRMPIEYASVVIMEGGVVKGGTKTDKNGNYLIRPLQKGKYDLKVTFIGYKETQIQCILLTNEKLIELNVDMEKRTNVVKGNIQAVIGLISTYPNIINAASPNEKKITREQIMNSPF